MSDKIRLLTTLVSLAAACALSGCRALNRTITDKAYESFGKDDARFVWTGGRTFKLDDDTLARTPFEGTAEFEHVRVSYPAGLADQARRITEHVARVTKAASDAIALPFAHQPRAWLLRVDDVPGSVNVNLKVDPNTMPLPLFVRVDRDDWHTILAESTIFPYPIVHEITEASLVMPRHGTPVAPDMSMKALLTVGFAIKNYTRWFREGLSNYAGYEAFRASAVEVDYDAEASAVHCRPFSALARVGDDLFRWHQYSDESLNDNYYNAALGLFLLIDRRYGPESIRAMVAGKDALEFADGKAMIRLANTVLKTDITKLAEDFRFPHTGLKLEDVTPAVVLNRNLAVERGLLVSAVEPNSIADAAGLKQADVITHAAGRPMNRQLDFELTIFDHLADDSVPLTVQRDRRPLTCALQIQKAMTPRSKH